MNYSNLSQSLSLITNDLGSPWTSHKDSSDSSDPSYPSELDSDFIVNKYEFIDIENNFVYVSVTDPEDKTDSGNNNIGLFIKNSFIIEGK